MAILSKKEKLKLVRRYIGGQYVPAPEAFRSRTSFTELGEEIPSLRGEGTRAEEEKEDQRSRQGGSRKTLPVGRTEQGPRGGIRRLLRSGVQLVPVLFTIRKEHGKVHR